MLHVVSQIISYSYLPFVKFCIYTILAKIFCKFLNPFLVLLILPSIGDKDFFGFSFHYS